MKKALIPLMLLLGAFAFAQDSDDFFSDSNDSVLEKARQKYDQRQEDEQADEERDGDKQRAIDLVRDEDPDEGEAADDEAAAEEPGLDPESDSDGESDLAYDDEDGEAPDASVEAEPANPEDRRRVRREMKINLFGIELNFSFETDPPSVGTSVNRPSKAKKGEPEAKAPKGAPYSPVVISILPGLSIPFGTYKTNLSLAAIGGITAEVNGIAASGVFDIIEGDLLGVQCAGIFSVVGGNAVAIQNSGIFNIVSGRLAGLQSAGVFNMAGDVLGFQSAGVFNMCDDLTGAQFAGVFNTARKVRGFQVAGVFNVAGDVKGAQVAGVVNVADEVKGVQVGLVNISKDMYGLPIGLLNFTLNGVRDIGFWQDSSNALWAFWANGTNNFYTIMYGGESLDDWLRDTDTIAFGYGLGARLARKPFRLDLDLSAKHYYGPRFAEMWNALGRAVNEGVYVGWRPSPVFPCLRATIGMPIFKDLELFGGVSADIGISGVCELPAEIRSPRSFGFPAFGRDIDVSPRFYWGLRL